MAQPSGKMTVLAAELVQRVAAGASAFADAWFSPLKPLAPVALPETAGRQYDYMTGVNLHTRPRSGELVGFAEMRALADGYDVLRLVIETRKDQMAKLPWAIKPRDKAGTLGDESIKRDPRCDELIQFFAMPDKEHDFDTWMRMLLEDLLVIDAPTIYPRLNLGGGLYALELVDGSTIKRVVNNWGRTPSPPDTAYQQVLKGMPAVDYTRDELIYKPRNVRTHKAYGYSPVEQIITTVNIALRRQTHQLSYYTDGSTPDLIFSVPESWTPTQLKEFEEYWNLLLSGQLDARRRTKFVPNGISPIDTKDKALKDEYDEWLARVVCFAFSISPQPFVKEMNRATAQTAQESALSEGLAPLMTWFKALMDRLLAQFGAADLEFAWESVESIKPKEQAEIDKIYVDAKILTADEVRAKRFGLAPLPKEDPPPAVPAITSATQATDDDAADKVAKSKKTVGTINRDRALVEAAAVDLQEVLTAFLSEEAALIAAEITAALSEIGKADTDGLVGKILNKITFGRWRKLVDIFGEKLGIVAKDGAAEALVQVGIEQTDDIVNQVNQQAVDWSRQHAAELVGMQIVDGELVVNPSPIFAITDSTRDMLRDTVTEAIEDGWSNDRLASEIEAHAAFGADRAELIARTETAIADIEGSAIAYDESGLVAGEKWLTAAGCCPKCAALSGKVVKFGEGFVPSGYRKRPPLHPRCRCDVLPVFPEDMPEDLQSDAQ